MLVDDERIDFEAILAFVATAVVLIRLVFMTIRWRDTAVKETFLAKWSK